jgi:hypothetical protein
MREEPCSNLAYKYESVENFLSILFIMQFANMTIQVQTWPFNEGQKKIIINLTLILTLL